MVLGRIYMLLLRNVEERLTLKLNFTGLLSSVLREIRPKFSQLGAVNRSNSANHAANGLVIPVLYLILVGMSRSPGAVDA